MTDEKWRWQPIKFNLEHAKLAISVAGLLGLALGVVQWRTGNQVAAEAVYQRMVREWSDHLRIFVDKPELRPYFEARKPLPVDEKQSNQVLALADLRLDAMDAVLTYGHARWPNKIEPWKVTFRHAFAKSPVLCDRLRETQGGYGLVVDVAKDGCAGR